MSMLLLFNQPGVSVTGTGALAAVSLTPATGSASAGMVLNGDANGTPAPIQLTAASGSASGSATATGTSAAVTLTSATGSASGSASASGSLAAISLTSASGSATGSASTDAPSLSGFLVAGRMKKRADDEARKKKKQDGDDEDKRNALLAEIVVVPVANKQSTRRLTMEQIIGKRAAAEMNYFDLALQVQAIKRKKRQTEEDEFMMMS